MRMKFKSAGMLFVGLCSLYLSNSACYAETGGAVLVEGKNNSGIQITQEQLSIVIKRYMKNTRKTAINKDEKINLLREMVRHQLLQKHDDVLALRADAEVQKEVQQYESNLILQKFMKDKIVNKIKVTEKDLKAYYQKNKPQYALPPTVEASHILLRTRADAEKVVGKLKEKVEFERLVAEYSIDLPLALTEKGKMSLYPISKGEAVAELDRELFTHLEGEISDIIETEYGFHIVRIDKHHPVSYKPFNKVIKDIKKVVTKEKYEKAYKNITSELEKTAQIEFFEDRIQ